MKSLLLAVLQAVIKSLVGSLNYEQIKVLVNRVDDYALTGAEKRALVIQDARNMGITVGAALVNLAIETAVNSLRK